MLINMKDLLCVARKNKFAVGAFNICDSLLFKCVIEAAEENNAPVIIELAPPELDFVGEDFISFVVKRLTKSSVPCVLHLDHGKTVEDCIKAIRCGFTSIMIDGSELSYEENIQLTKQVTKLTKCLNVSVEGEIGTIGALKDSVEGGVEKVTYTQPEQVIDYIERTHVDSLAIAIGTAHGIYPEGMVPKLHLNLLKEINKKTNHPLVLHGGSSNKDEEISEACKNGICKVNIASDYRRVFFEQTKKTLIEKNSFWTPDVYESAIIETKKTIVHKISLFGSLNKSAAYKV